MTAPSPTAARQGALHEDDLPAPPVAPEGLPIIAMFVVGAVILSALAAWLHPVAGAATGVATLVLCVWCVWFFRDPRRRIPLADAAGRALLVSPADGVVNYVGPAKAPPGLGLTDDQLRGTTRVSVFMNVFNVHVNRAPAACRVQRLVYSKGKFLNASLDKASEDNERMALVLDVPGLGPMVCVQIAGLIARRIVCRVKEGTPLRTGERFGLIRFGSRVDVYLPEGVAPLVKVGDRSVAGETVFAVLPAPAAPAPVVRVDGAAVGAGSGRPGGTGGAGGTVR